MGRQASRFGQLEGEDVIAGSGVEDKLRADPGNPRLDHRDVRQLVANLEGDRDVEEHLGGASGRNHERRLADREGASGSDRGMMRRR